jgi:hypothetical protein
MNVDCSLLVDFKTLVSELSVTPPLLPPLLSSKSNKIKATDDESNDEKDEKEHGEDVEVDNQYSTPPVIMNNIPWTRRDFKEFCEQLAIFGTEWKQYAILGKTKTSINFFSKETRTDQF